MKKLFLPMAEKLLQLRNGEKIQASKLRQAIFQELLSENILYKTGRTRGLVLLVNAEQFDLYLQNHYSIANLEVEAGGVFPLRFGQGLHRFEIDE